MGKGENMDRLEGDRRVQPEPTITTGGSLPLMEILDGIVDLAKQARAFSWGDVHEPLAAAYLEILGPEIMACREAQDAKWGGPDHDDTHTWDDWCFFIGKWISPEKNYCLSHGEFEVNMIHVAALAIAAIQSSRRKWPRPVVKSPEAQS